MRKGLLYIGLLLLAAGIIVALLSMQLSIPQEVRSPIAKQLVLAVNSLVYVPLTLNQTGAAIIYFNSSAPVDFYFANTAAFGTIGSSQVSGGKARNASISLEGNGVYEVYENSRNGTYPYAYQGVAVPSYVVNSSVLLYSGTYYAIFANSGNVSATIGTRMIAVPLSSISSEGQTIVEYGAATLLLIVSGLIVIVLSLFLKPKEQQKTEEMNEDVKKAYDAIEKHKKR